MRPKSNIDPTHRHPFEVTTGRRTTDGRLRLEIFSPGMIAISVEAADNVLATRLLTVAQSRLLREALNELIEVVESGLEKKSASAAESVAWSGVVRRARGRMILI